MRETRRSNRAILRDLRWGDSRKRWLALCQLCSLSQNPARIHALLPYRAQIAACVEPGGGIYGKNVHLERVLAILDFYARGGQCPCHLLGTFDHPAHLIEDGYFLPISKGEPECCGEAAYTLRCRRCGAVYRAQPREYHTLWWEWTERE